MQSEALKILPKEMHLQDSLPFFIQKSVTPKNFPLHRHEFFEIELILSGEGYCNINGHKHRIKKNHYLFFTPADFHDIILTSDEPLVAYNIIFSTSLLWREICALLPLKLHIAELTDENAACLQHVCQYMLSNFQSRSPNLQFIMKSGVELCLLHFADAAQNMEISTSYPQDMSVALSFIYDNFTKGITRNDVAAALHISPLYFSRLFHEKMGVTFQTFLLDLRLEFARKLLSSEDITVYAAAHESGFNSASYFSSVYTKKFGHPPNTTRAKKV